MQFLKSVAICASALAAFAAAQSTQVAIYNMPDTVMVGKATQLQIHSGSGPFTLTLRRGNPNDLQNVSTITTTGTGNSYSWTPDANLESGSDYAIMISQGDQSNYTPEFTISGGKSAGSGSSPGSYGGASSSSAASSTLSTAAKTSAASTAPGCAVTQIKDGQPQAPASCSSSAAAAASSAPAAASTPAYATSNSTATAAPAAGNPYTPQSGATGSPASNSTVPTYSVPSPTGGSSGSGSSSGGSSASAAKPQQTGAAAQFGSSFALIACAVAAFAFLN